jgi:hypothetical protein
MGWFATLSIMPLGIENRYADCRDYLNVMVSVVMLNVVMLSVVAHYQSFILNEMCATTFSRVECYGN